MLSPAIAVYPRPSLSLLPILSFLVAALLVCMLPETAQAMQSWGIMSDTHIGITKTVGNPKVTIDPSEELKTALQVMIDETKGKNRQAVFNLGDVTNEGVHEDAIDEYLNIISSYGEADMTPYHQVIGNHDLYNFGRYSSSTDIAARTQMVQQALHLFKSKLSSGVDSAVQFYEFDHVNFILLGDASLENAVDGNLLTSSAKIGGNRFSAATRDFLNKKLLQTVRAGKIAIVMCHYPYYDKKYLSKSDRSTLYSILTSYPNTYYFAGHRHSYTAHGASNYVVASAASLAAMTTKYNKRVGYSSCTRYPVCQVGIDSTYRFLGGTLPGNPPIDSSISVLEDVDSGKKLTIRSYDVTAGTSRSRELKRQTGSVKIVPTTDDPKDVSRSRKGRYKVIFSDGGTYAGVSSGSNLSLRTGETKMIPGIPAGVLVTVSQTRAASGYKNAPKRQLEV